MPFVQRVVQPTYLSRLQPTQTTHGTASGSGVTKFQCIPGKCKNNNCISQQQHQQQQHQQQKFTAAARIDDEEAKKTDSNGVARTSHPQQQQSTTTTTTTTAIVHQPTAVAPSDFGKNEICETAQDATDFVVSSHHHTNGFASSFSYATDNEEENHLSSSTSYPLSLQLQSQSQLHAKLSVVGGSNDPAAAAAAALLPMKKLKQHVEFLSTSPTSPNRSGFGIGADANYASSQPPSSSSASALTSMSRQQTASPTVTKIVTGYEFDSISNITLSNALRQLASLVLIASDIFDDLQQELQNIGERSRAVQRKITVVEQKVCAYDPKLVTVPESDLLTFAQRKIHYESDKLVRKELFTVETRPCSVKVLYEDAGKPAPPSYSATSPRSTSFASGDTLNGVDGFVDSSGTGASQAAGSNELVCTPVFGKANRKMRTRIDAEIEIRLPAAIEDLRKWTSTEALGDVTVTPDCMHHVDTSISTSMVIGDNGILTPALSPSVLSADAVDALYSINISNAANNPDNTQLPNDINKDVPLNHRLPSPEEQCKIIALRYPAELISVDTSGKRFERMCLARKSTTGCIVSIADSNNLNDDVQTVSRRSRSRKVRGKRRNTIAGIDQKEIQDAANGDSTATSSEIKNTLATVATNADDAEADADGDGEESMAATSSRRTDKSKKFGRSKSSDILKKESVALPYDKGKSTLTRLNSLKQWGRNRFKFMQRNETSAAATVASSLIMTNSGSHDTSGNGCSSNAQNTISAAKSETNVIGGSKSTTKANKLSTGKGGAQGSVDIDDACVVHDLIHGQKSESRFSHERKPSYSSSEKSMSVSSSGQLKGKLHLASCGGSGNVKLRDTSSLNRQRRNGITTNGGLSGKDEQPHSSSGNWSASSESGRASIGSEITIQPKSSASNTSLNVSSFHPGSSGPPSSMLSRRRFLNTSASSSVTSEGTATPELQMADTAYNNHLDDETSSAYSCDTEGYYTSFHMDSGLRTLKEEEPPMTPLQIGQNLHTSSYSFGSQSNQTVLTAENEYELYGRGSTSTTTSSAGTVCTTLMVNEHNSCNSVLGPDVPERISSLGKLNRSSHSNSASTSTLERSYSSSTIGSTLERTGTIKRNVNASLKLLTKEADEIDAQSTAATGTPDSQEEEFDFEQRMRKRSAQPLPHVVAELEYSESSDLEGVERIERIKQKTAINVKRIPSMCIITPSTSDDENHAKDGATFDPNKTLTPESSPLKAAESTSMLQFKVNEVTGYCTIDVTASDELRIEEAPPTPTKNAVNSEGQKDHNLNVLAKRNSNYGFNNVLEKLRVVLPNIKRSPSKNSPPSANTVLDDDELYDTAGEYVTIADISNNNRRRSQLQQPKALGASLGLGIYYSNDIVRRRAATATQQQQANEPLSKATRENESDTEYISLNELPYHLRKIEEAFTRNSPTQHSTMQNDAGQKSSSYNQCAESATGHGGAVVVVPMYAEITEQPRERTLISPTTQSKGARVKFNAQGKPIYDSDSLKRRKGAHTTFAPGPYVKETESTKTSTISSSESATAKAINFAKSNAANAKLLFLNGGGVAANSSGTPRKVANVRPIVATTPLQSIQRATNTNTTNAMSAAGHYNSAQTNTIDYNYNENKNLLANHTNPFFNTGTGMLPSPSTKSTSSTGSTTSSSTNSTNTQCSSFSASTSSSTTTTKTSAAMIASIAPQNKDEDYQHLYKTSDHQRTQPVLPYQSQQLDATANMPFQRNAPIYWTLQNRKQVNRTVANSATSRDDLYATPIRRSERVARAAAAAQSSTVSTASISPIVPRNRSSSVGFLTSTPTQLDSQLPADNIPAKQPSARCVNWDDNSPERLNTCADRIGQSKTSLLDFKKLLLAKSVKSSPVQKKVSAVELLKKSTSNVSATNSNANVVGGTLPVNPTTSAPLNSSMKLLDLSGSPKTFANRRMLRQGQFGSPSKSFAPKIKTSPGVAGWRGHNTVHRTDIMSTTIPEANSEEDQSTSTNSSSGSTKVFTEVGADDAEERLKTSTTATVSTSPATTAAEKFNLKRNFFLQTEENNFMKGELKKPFAKTTLLGTPAVSSGNSNQYVIGPVGCITAKTTTLTDATNYVATTGQFVSNISNSTVGTTGTGVGVGTNVAHAMPALETAL